MRKLPPFLILILLVLSLNFCKRSKYPGFARIADNLFIHLIETGEGVNKVRPGNYLFVDIRYKTMDDSVFFQGLRNFKLDTSLYVGSFTDAVTQLFKGDSAVFILDARKFYKYMLSRDLPDFLSGDGMMKMDIRVKDVQSEEEFEAEKDLFLIWVKEFQLSEYQIIENYLKTNKLTIKPEPNGIYFLSHKEGKGPSVKKGKHVWVTYSGKFLNGRFVDPSSQGREPLDFYYGDELILIRGLDYAMGKMNEGGKAVVLIPSSMGFGNQGSTGGHIPPFTALIYEIEIVKVE